MINTIDIFSNVAQYLEWADDYVSISHSLWTIPLDILQRMHVKTKRMLLNHDCLLRDPSMLWHIPRGMMDSVIQSHPSPDMLAEYMLMQSGEDAGFDSILPALGRNNNWADREKKIAVQYVLYVMYTYNWFTIEFKDTELMKRLCRYDIVFSKYSWYYIRDHLETLIDHLHDRKLIDAYIWSNGEISIAIELARICPSHDLEKFLDAIARVGDIMTILDIIDDLGLADRLREKYTHFYCHTYPCGECLRKKWSALFEVIDVYGHILTFLGPADVYVSALPIAYRTPLVSLQLMGIVTKSMTTSVECLLRDNGLVSILTDSDIANHPHPEILADVILSWLEGTERLSIPLAKNTQWADPFDDRVMAMRYLSACDLPVLPNETVMKSLCRFDAILHHHAVSLLWGYDEQPDYRAYYHGRTASHLQKVVGDILDPQTFPVD